MGLKDRILALLAKSALNKTVDHLHRSGWGCNRGMGFRNWILALIAEPALKKSRDYRKIRDRVATGCEDRNQLSFIKVGQFHRSG
jgi:hypothetical protein